MADNTQRTLEPPSLPPRSGSSMRLSSMSRSPSSDALSLLSNEDLAELRINSEPRTPNPVYPIASSSAPASTSRIPHSTMEKSKSNTANARTANPDTRKKSWRIRLLEIWENNYGLMLVFLAQVFATFMNVATGLLEGQGVGGGMHPFQILFARMSITVLCSLVYMWSTSTPHWPLGAKDVRWLLVLRGVGGFFGVFGLYWSLQYLPLSDATVITFLAPTLACYACSKFTDEPFTRTELIGGIVSLIGVVLIARPTYLFDSSTSSTPSPTDAANPTAPATAQAASGITPTPGQHLAAIGMAIVGVFGAASAYTTIRIIGHRAHPLISVTYFSFWCTLVSLVALTFVPSIPFVLPSTLYQWTLLLFIGVSGFVMQFLLTAGLRAEKSGRATNMVYTQMIFALAAEKIIWDTTPGLWSWMGSALIMGAAGAVAMQKSAVASGKGGKGQGESDTGRDEEEATGMLMHDAEMHQLGNDSDDDEEEVKMQEEHEEKRGRSLSIDDDITLRPSTDYDGSGDIEKELRKSMENEGNWRFSQLQEQPRRHLPHSEEVSPHSPAVGRKQAVFWSK